MTKLYRPVNTSKTLWPIGSIYLSVNSTSPQTLFGGTWTQISNRFLYCVTSGAKETGGSSTTGSTTLTVDQIPAHTHGSKSLTGSHYTYDYVGSRANGIVSETVANANGVGFGSRGYNETPWKQFAFNATHEHSSVGGGKGHTHSQNLPPYFKIYAWYRTA